MPTKTHLQDLTYKNSHARLKYEDSLTKTHLHNLIHDNKPTETYLRELTYEKKPTRTYLQEKVYQNSLAISHLRQLNYKNLRLTKSFLGKHDYENSSRDLTYENKPTRTRITLMTLTLSTGTSTPFKPTYKNSTMRRNRQEHTRKKKSTGIH